MNEAKMRKLLAGHTATANKIFLAVPIQEMWTATSIHKTLMLGGSITSNVRAIHGSLLDLKDCGLIKEPKAGFFQRATISVKSQPLTLNEIEVKEAYMKTPNNAPAVTLATVAPKAVADLAKGIVPAVAAAPVAPTAAMDVLVELSKEVSTFATEFAARLQNLSERIEDVAVNVGIELEASAAGAARLKQLQSLLKEMA